MTSFGKHAYLHVYSNSHTTYQINPFFFCGAREHYRSSQGLFSVVTFNTVEPERF